MDLSCEPDTRNFEFFVIAIERIAPRGGIRGRKLLYNYLCEHQQNDGLAFWSCYQRLLLIYLEIQKR